MTEKSKRAVRVKLEEFGLRILCVNCGWEGRHFARKQGRLRERICPDCETPRRLVATAAYWRRVRQVRELPRPSSI